MLYGIFATLFCILGLFTILLVMVQRGHGGFFGGTPGDSTALFGGSGGTDVLQKVTWACGFLLIVSTFSLAIYRTSLARKGKYTGQIEVLESQPQQEYVTSEEATSEGQEKDETIQ